MEKKPRKTEKNGMVEDAGKMTRKEIGRRQKLT